jgi:hypothetical protein
LELADYHAELSPQPAEAGPAPVPATAPTEPAPHPAGAIRDVQDRYAAGDYSGALMVAEGILQADPNNADAQRYVHSCRDVLTHMYTARLGPLDRVAKVAIPVDQIRWLSLDHRAGFLLSLVDGTSRIEEILDISGMPHLDALRILLTLLEQRVIVIE